MKQKLSSLSFSVMLYALGIQQLAYLYDAVQWPCRCAVALLMLYAKRIHL